MARLFWTFTIPFMFGLVRLLSCLWPKNPASQLITGSRRQKHISQILSTLHWFPVCYRTDLKMLLLMFNCLNGLAPPYLSDLLQPYVPSRSLRSADHLTFPCPENFIRDQQAYVSDGCKLWNGLHFYVRWTTSLLIFKSQKSIYFL